MQDVYGGPFRVFGPHRFSPALAVHPDNAVCEIQDGAGGAEVLLQFDYPGPREIMFKIRQEAYIGTTP